MICECCGTTDNVYEHPVAVPHGDVAVRLCTPCDGGDCANCDEEVAS